ncbi:MAG: nitroreductase family protein [Acetobacteraceae bacterium]|jgi:hypothetical protein|nr:nitroreductase family protein [Acetobacteraceae bacterium]
MTTRLSRRGMLAATAALPLASGCGPDRDDFRDEADPLTGRLSGTARAVLHQAAFAPSSHNIQPWVVTIEEERRWRLGADPARRLPAVDPANREPIISLGCFAETLIQAAAGFGLAVEAEVVAAANTDETVAMLAAREGQRERGRVAAIGHRRTLREGFLDRAIRPAELAALLGAEAGDVRVLPRGSPGARWCEEATVVAARAQAARDAAQGELADWIRFRPAAQREHRDGLTPAMMGLTGPAGLWVSWMYRRDDVMSAGFRETGIARTAAQAKAGAGWLVLTAPEESPRALFEAGRAWQRLWLRAPEAAIGLHPMSYALQEAGGQAAARAALGVDRPIVALLRIGHVESYPRPVSLRRPPSAWVRLPG